jgi:hypothetical protein
MKPFLIFIGGVVTGALLMFLILYVVSVSTERSQKEKLELISSLLSDQYPNAEVQYVEVKLKNRYVELHTGMSKDSVQILVGKPDKVSLNTIMGTSYERWGYKLKNKSITDLDIEFADGKLNEIRQN